MNKYKLCDLQMPLLGDYPIIEETTARTAILKYLLLTNKLTPYTDVERSSDRNVPFLIKKIEGKRWMGYKLKKVDRDFN